MEGCMMRKSLVLVLLLILTVSMYASNGTQIGTVGARSTAMGSCFRGLSDDWSAVFFNPAGLTQLGKLTIGVSGGLIMPRGSYEAANYSVYPTTALVTKKVDVTPQNFLVPALGAFYKPSDKLSLGLGVYAPFGLGTEWDLINLPADYGNIEGLSKKNEHYSDHQVITIQPTVAYNITDKLSVGLGGCYIIGSMTIDQVVMAMNPFSAEVAPGVTQWSYMRSQGLPLLPLDAIQNRLAVENGLEGDGSAMGVNVGLLFKATDKLSIGLSAKYTTDLALSGTIEQAKLMFGDAEQMAVINQIPAAYLANEADPTGEVNKQQMLGLFSGMTLKDTWDIEADLPLPLNVGLGLAYKFSPQLTVTADASMTQWSSWDEIVVKSKDANHDDLVMKEDWKDTWEIGAGIEFKPNEILALRGGFYTVDTPSPEETISPTILDPNRRWTITAGLGYKVGKIPLSLAGEWVVFPEKEMISNYYEYDAAGTPENYAGIYNFAGYVITLATQIEL
jgi:long-chain fatty acid transport protein